VKGRAGTRIVPEGKATRGRKDSKGGHADTGRTPRSRS
jgi:hypothetical protein